MISTYWLSCRGAFLVAACTCSFVDLCRPLCNKVFFLFCLYLPYVFQKRCSVSWSPSYRILLIQALILFLFCPDLDLSQDPRSWYFESYRESGKSKKLLVDVNYNKPIAKAATSVTIPVQLVKVRISRTWTNCEPVTELCSLSVDTDNIKLPSSANLILDEHCCNCGLNNR